MRAFIAVTFLLLAVWFHFGPPSASPRSPGELSLVSLDALDPYALRVEITDPPTIELASLQLRCSSCHALFPSRPEPPAFLLQHGHVELRHGTLERCTECHIGPERDQLLLKEGIRVGFDESIQHCASCHEPTASEWEEGVHGRALDRTDPRSDGQGRLTCLQCHDPHLPAFEPVAPLPGPKSSRLEPRK
jgi:hypothetical protein